MQSSLKKACINNKKIDRVLNKKTGIFEMREVQCDCIVDPRSEEFTLESYCEECRKPFEKKINTLLPLEGRNADLKLCDKTIQDYYNKIFIKNKKGLFLWGKPGVGKTWAQYAIIKRLILSSDKNNFKDIEIYSMSKIYSDLTEGQFDKDFKSSDYKERICDTEILMIDDLGVEKISDFRQEILEYIFNTRCKNEKLTLITSNYKLDDLIDRVGGGVEGERITSRILKMCEIIEMEGEDRRLPCKNQNAPFIPEKEKVKLPPE